MPYITEYVYQPARKPVRQRAISWALICGIIAALVLITLPFLPQLTYNVQVMLPAHQQLVVEASQQATAPQPPGSGNWLLIPAINVKTQIVDGLDIGILDHKTGVWHQLGDPQSSNFVIAGHRFKYLPPNQTTLYNLDKLQHNDQIVIWWQGQQYQYTITSQFTVDRNATQILNPTSQPQLTLYTCTDLNASHRLVVIAIPTK